LFGLGDLADQRNEIWKLSKTRVFT